MGVFRYADQAFAVDDDVLIMLSHVIPTGLRSVGTFTLRIESNQKATLLLLSAGVPISFELSDASAGFSNRDEFDRLIREATEGQEIYIWSGPAPEVG